MSTNASAKRKKPPTFQHLPINRAKKLKKAWVENKKIKSKWKAEKRKERSQVEDVSTAAGDVDEEGTRMDEVVGIGSHSGGEASPSSRAGRDTAMEITAVPAPATKSSLRDVTTKAYSHTSLHSFKSDPLQRRRGSGDERGTRGRRGRNDELGRGRGRSQPNMKLRMDAMLQKIKRDFS